MFQVFAYRRTLNIGDAFQTVALSRLLGPRLIGVYRDDVHRNAHSSIPFVVNGWIGEAAAPTNGNCLFAGVHLGRNVPEQLAWIKASRFPAGSRDPAASTLMSRHGIVNTMVGCATMTFERYTGPRTGRYVVDVPATIDSNGATAFTNFIPKDMTWADQWKLALERLDLLRRAEVVYTARLHVALPCLAFGTPVVLYRRVVERSFQPDRFTILNALGFAYDTAGTIDMTGQAERYMAFLSNALGVNAKIGPPVFPSPVNEREMVVKSK